MYENIAFGLKIKKIPKDEIDRRVARAADVLGLEPYLQRKPRALSGGQRQRVAMGRAIVREPAAFLMDEPLSNLDAKLRVQTRAEIAKLQHDLGVTTIYVTHDQVEAMTMGHRVAVMRKGELQQVADPQTLYDEPVNLFVGGFIGSPSMNMLEATLEQSNGTLTAVAGSQRVHLDEETLSAPAGAQGVRRPARDPRHPARGHRGRRARRRRSGRPAAEGDTSSCARRSARRSWCTSASTRSPPRRTTRRSSRRTCTAKERCPTSRAGAKARSSSAVSARARSVKEGAPIEAAVDTRALHFFDPDSGLGIYKAGTKGAA